jgi:hypothetical protein
MPSLAELQRQFVAQLLRPDGDLPESIRTNGLSSAARLGVYRNNTLTGLGKALAAVYPVVERLVGEEFFRHATRIFIRRYPSRCGDVGEYGAEFADFLAEFEPARALAYLPDVARMEWARHLAARAADQDPLDLAALGRVTPDDYESLHFALHPSARLLESAWPVLRIWEINQPGHGDEERVDLREGGCRLLIWRHGLALRQRALPPGEYRLLQAMAEGLDFGSACELALAAEPECGIGELLPRWIVDGVIVDFSVRGPFT